MCIRDRVWIEDELVSVLLGGLLSGFGIGQILTTGGSAGGVEILGMWAVKRLSLIHISATFMFIRSGCIPVDRR